jgi:hypothetical protein
MAFGCIEQKSSASAAERRISWNTPAEETAEKEARAPFALIEMFTSEGCSNCPPAYIVADGLIDKARKENQKVLILDFHVDYWNNLGWTDPYSSKTYSERQARYSKVFKGAGLYTPQMVVNGKEEFVGSDEDKANEVIGQSMKEKPAMTLKINSILPAQDSISISFDAKDVPANSVLNIALTQNSATSHVLKGENQGKTLTHHNVVRVFDTFGLETGSGNATVKIPSYAMPAGEGFSLVAYAQDAKNMQVLAADKKPVDNKGK